MLKSVNNRPAPSSWWHRAGWVLAFAGWAVIAPPSPADDTNAPADDASTNAATPPFLSTNSPSSTFLETHPELTQPSTTESPSLSLRPNPAPTNAPPEVNPPGVDIFPDTTPKTNPLLEVEHLADHLLVVYNANDPDSKDLAQYYAAQRQIPAERVFAIYCPLTEEITRQQYDDTIRSPIVSYLCRKNWMFRVPEHTRVGGRSLDVLVAVRNDIWAIVLMRGVPLKIAPDPSGKDCMESEPALETTAAAVDNELALLPVFGLPEGGYVPNIFFDDQVQGIKRVGADLARNMVLVTRLDGPQPSDVRRMIDDTLYAENNRLAGLAVVDTRGLTDPKDAYTAGDVWLRNSRDMLVRDGWHIKFDDSPDVLPASDPLNQVAIYLGWYHDGAIGPWVTPPNRFVRGAIAYHLHSFSASTLRSDTVGWAGPLIAHGAAATMGTVYEPYLALTPHEDIFSRRLLQGDYFAEAAYAAEPGLSWMLTVVGDPLYRPFRMPLDSALAQAGPRHTPHEDWLLLQKVQRQLAAGSLVATTASMAQALDVPGAGSVAEEGLGDLLETLSDPTAGPAAEQAYQKALTRTTVPLDCIRVGMKLADYESSHGQDLLARAELVSLRDEYPQEARQFGISGPMVPASLAPVNIPSGHELSIPPHGKTLPPAPPKTSPGSP